MALRAGYYGLKGNIARKLQDEFEKLDGIIPAAASADNPLATETEINGVYKNDAITGAKNLTYPAWKDGIEPMSIGISFVVGDDYSITLSGISSAAGARNIATYTGAQVKAIADKIILNGGDPEFTKIYFGLVSSDYNYAKVSRGEDVLIDTSELTDATIYYLKIGIEEASLDTTGAVIKPMIRSEYDTDPTYVPFVMTNKELTASASDQKTTINAIISAATGAADFAAFKAAMEAITPVTRLIQVTPETREEITEPVEEVKKTTRKKSTAKADTEKEGE